MGVIDVPLLALAFPLQPLPLRDRPNPPETIVHNVGYVPTIASSFKISRPSSHNGIRI